LNLGQIGTYNFDLSLNDSLFLLVSLGLAMAGYGITASITSVVTGYLAKWKYGRPGCILLASLLSYTIFIVMLVWIPNVAQAYVLYILACIGGIVNATLVTFAPGLKSSLKLV
jgi:MFS family permease